MNERNKNFRMQNELNREMQREKEFQHKRRVKALLARVGLLAMLLVVSTYAWFTSQKDITLSNIRGTVEVVENMEISLDAKTWYQRIDLADAINTFTTAQTSRDLALNETDTKSTALAIVPEQLFPVSGVAKTGTGVTLLPLYTGEATSTSLSAIAQCVEEKVEDGKDVAVDNGYIAFDMYIKNTSRDNEADILQLNINSSVQVLTETITKEITDVLGNRVNRTYNGNEDAGLQNTVRVALAKYGGEVSSTATQLEILNSTKDATIADVAIWEPNAYDHVETIVSNNNRLINTSNANKIEFTSYHPNTPLETYALTDTAVGQTIENVYNIASTGLKEQSTFKTDNIKSVNYATDGIIESYRIKTEDSKPLNIKNTNNLDFQISSNAVTRYRVYIWLEGQDVDCINVASLGGGIELDLGLTKDDEIGDVLNEVDNRVTYSEIDGGTNKVTATITMDKVITPLPTGWEYSDGTQKVIEKEYGNNIIEQVEVKTEDGKISKIEVTIDEFETEIVEPLQTLISQITTDKAGNYGLHTNYPVDIDGDATDNDWKIFYSDNERVFLIADDYVPHANIGSTNLSAACMTTYGTYEVEWSDYDSLNYTISADNKYMLSRAASFSSTNNNYKKTGSLLDTSIWTAFVNNTYAEDAIGSPTLEMWVESWNTVYNYTNYPNQQLFCNGNSVYGYTLGIESEPSTFEVDISEWAGYMNNDYKSTMYFPHKTEFSDIFYYWIASPAGNYSSDIYIACYEGWIGTGDVGGVALRNVVSLKPEVTATKVGDVWELSSN